MGRRPGRCGRRTRHINSTGGSTMSTHSPASSPTSPPMHESNLHGLTRIHQGKVRDIYSIPGDDRHMLIVTTDRLSAFDVVLPDPIPGKGRVLTSISNYWFARTGHIVPNHLAGATFPLERAGALQHRLRRLRGGAVRVRGVLATGRTGVAHRRELRLPLARRRASAHHARSLARATAHRPRPRTPGSKDRKSVV